MSEHSIQSSFFDWTNWMANSDPRFSLFFAIPNGGFRHLTTARKLKAEGVKKGVPDVLFAYPYGRYAGLFMEFKYGKNKASSDQVDWMKKLRSVGYAARIVYSSEEGQQIVSNYLAGGQL